MMRVLGVTLASEKPRLDPAALQARAPWTASSTLQTESDQARGRIANVPHQSGGGRECARAGIAAEGAEFAVARPGRIVDCNRLSVRDADDRTSWR